MRTFLYYPLFVWLACLLSCGTSQEESNAGTPSRDSLATAADAAPLPGPDTLRDSDTRITGLLQTSGLQPQEARALGIEEAAYQLISRQPHFLVGSDSLRHLVGQCVTLIGRREPGWPQQPEDQTAYGRGLFRVEQIRPRPFGACQYGDSTATQPQGRDVTYIGTVARMQRPAPDISYDYQLRLREPYRDDNHPIAPGQLVRSLPLVAADREVLSLLEQGLASEALVQIKGVQHQGYAEQQAVWVVEIIRPNL